MCVRAKSVSGKPITQSTLNPLTEEEPDPDGLLGIQNHGLRASASFILARTSSTHSSSVNRLVSLTNIQLKQVTVNSRIIGTLRGSEQK